MVKSRICGNWLTYKLVWHIWIWNFIKVIVFWRVSTGKVLFAFWTNKNDNNCLLFFLKTDAGGPSQSKYLLTMLLKLVTFILFSTRECSSTFGKITMVNKAFSTVRVTLSPSINWNYYEQRTNQTLLKNPDKITGGNIIMWVSWSVF